MPYYPGHSFAIGLTTIRRERRLPVGAFGEVAVRELQRVEADTVLLRGTSPGDFIIVDLLDALGLKSIEQFDDSMIQVPLGQVVEKGRIIAQNGKGRGAKTLKAPAQSVISRVEGRQLILQLAPEPLEVYAMCPGTVTSVRGNNEVLLETSGSLIECAWGNNKRVYSMYRFEPEGGLGMVNEELGRGEWSNNAVILNRPLDSMSIFSQAKTFEITAIIAPSMRSEMREAILKQQIPVLLTEGFGELQMTNLVYNLLRDNLGRPALIDATEPDRWSTTRPEIVIPLPTGGTMPPAPVADQALQEGAVVRLTRSPYAGQSGRIRRILEAPRMVESGLRFAGAEVVLQSGQTVFVPLANMEMLGRITDV
jgi:hypothetical protein